MADDDDTSTSTEGGTSSDTGTFTQADVDRIVRERIARERKNFSDYDELKDKATKFDELSDKQKSDMDRLTERANAAEKRATEAETKALRAEVASSKGLTASQAKRLSGSTKEELESDADELLEAFGTKPDTGKGDEPDDDGAKGGDTQSRRPKERLRPGAAPDSEPQSDPDELADAVLSKKRGY